MPETLQKLIPVGAAFAGASLMMTFLKEMPNHRWIVAIGVSACITYFGMSTVMAFLTSTFSWFPSDDGARGLIGFFIGLGSIFFMGAFATLGKRVADNPSLPGAN